MSNTNLSHSKDTTDHTVIRNTSNVVLTFSKSHYDKSLPNSNDSNSLMKQKSEMFCDHECKKNTDSTKSSIKPNISTKNLKPQLRFNSLYQNSNQIESSCRVSSVSRDCDNEPDQVDCQQEQHRSPSLLFMHDGTPYSDKKCRKYNHDNLPSDLNDKSLELIISRLDKLSIKNNLHNTQSDTIFERNKSEQLHYMKVNYGPPSVVIQSCTNNTGCSSILNSRSEPLPTVLNSSELCLIQNRKRTLKGPKTKYLRPKRRYQEIPSSSSSSIGSTTKRITRKRKIPKRQVRTHKTKYNQSFQPNN